MNIVISFPVVAGGIALLGGFAAGYLAWRRPGVAVIILLLTGIASALILGFRFG